MEQRELIETLLSFEPDKDSRRSCLTMALKAARKHTGRDSKGKDIKGIFNDEVFDEDRFHSEYFSGLVLYLILLEQIGCLFKNIDCNEQGKTNGIKIALENFSAIKDEAGKINAIYGLRNSLAHNFSLANQKPPRYKFCLVFEEMQEPIIPKPYDEINFDKKENYEDTLVGVPQLCDLIENVFAELVSKQKEGKLELRIRSLNEIRARFTII